MRYTLFLLLASALMGQQNPLTVTAAAPQQIQGVNINYGGPRGQSESCYWVIVAYPIGNVPPATPSCIFAGATITSGNSATVQWNAMQGAVNYTVLRTTTESLPSTCTNCLLISGTTSTSFTDIGNSLAGFTLSNIASPVTQFLQLDNQNYSTPQLFIFPYPIRIGNSIVFPDGSVQTTASGAGTVLSVSATPPVVSSGGANPNISCTTCTTGAPLSNSIQVGNGTQNLQSRQASEDNSGNISTPGSLATGVGGGAGQITEGPVLFAALPAPSNGTLMYCSDCTINTSPCVGGGTGAFAQYLNGAWTCGSSGGAPTGAAGGDLGSTYPNPTVVSGSHITNSSIPNSGLVNTGTTVNGQTCTLGSTCTATAAPSGTAGGDLSSTYPNPTVSKVNGNTPGGTCTNQAATAIDSSGRPTCTTLTSAYVNNSIALTGTDINTSNQVTVTHLASPLPAAQGGTAVANTASLTLGSSNVNLATLGTGIVKNTTTTGALTDATGQDLNTLLTCPTSSASGTAEVCNTTPTFTPIAGSRITFQADIANTGAFTLNVNSLGAKSVKKNGNVALVANDILASPFQCLMVYDGTNWEMQGQVGNAPTTGTVTTVSAPTQFTVTNPTTTPAISYPTLPNSYTEDTNSPYLQNFAIRHNILWEFNGTSTIQTLGDLLTVVGTLSAQVPTSSLPMAGQIAVANGSSVGASGNQSQRTGRTVGMRLTCMVYIGTSLTNVRTGCGVGNGTVAQILLSGQPARIYAEIVFDQSGAMGGTNGGTPDSTHWLVCTGTDATHQTCAATGVTVATGTNYKLEIFEDIANSRWDGFVNGAETDEATNNPASGTNLNAFAGAWGTGAVTGTWNFSMLQVTSDW